MSQIHHGSRGTKKPRSLYKTAIALAVSGALAGALTGAVTPSVAAEPTEKHIEFESLNTAVIIYDNDENLISGEDYQNGDNGGSASQNQLKTENNGNASGSRQLAGVTTGAWIRYQNVDLGENYAVALQIRYDAPVTRVVDGQVELYVAELDEPMVEFDPADALKVVDLPNTGETGWGTHATVTVDLDLPATLTGAHDLYMRFVSSPDGDHPYVGNFDYFRLLYTIKGDLDAAIAQYSSYTENPQWYSPDEYQEFADALEAAEVVSADPDATYVEAQAAAELLNEKASALVWLIVGELDSLILEALLVNQSDVTVATWDNLQSALAIARNMSTWTNSHAEFEAAFDALEEALEDIVLLLESEITITSEVPESIEEGTELSLDVAVTAGATGDVAIVESGVTLTTATLDEDSNASVTLDELTPGTHTLSAHYLGDSAHKDSTSDPVMIEVTEIVIPDPVDPDPVDPDPIDPAPAVTITAPVVSGGSQVFGASAGRVTLSSSVAGATSGTVTFRSGTTVLGAAVLTRQGTVYRASVTVAPRLAVGTYGSLTAAVRTSDGKTVTSAVAPGSFRVVKANIKKLKAKAAKKATKGKKTWVRVVVSKKLNNGVAPRGKVRVFVGKKRVRQVKVKKVINNGGKLKLSIPKKFVKGKKLKIRTVFVPGAKDKAGVAKRTAKANIKIRR